MHSAFYCATGNGGILGLCPDQTGPLNLTLHTFVSRVIPSKQSSMLMLHYLAPLIVSNEIFECALPLFS